MLKLGYKASAEQFDPATLLHFSVLAENLGFDSVFTSDHFQPWRHTNGHAGNALVWLGALGAATKRVTIGTSVLTPTFRYHPSVVAQAFATLGQMFPGRVILGIGSGEALNEVPSAGIVWPEMKERFARMRESVQLMRKLWTEEFVWHKRNSYPGKWPNRFRDAWERCLQFNKARKFNMYQDEVMVPMGDWAKTRLRNLSHADKRRDESRVSSGFGKNVSNWRGREKAYPTNVLHLATESSNRHHSAAFPQALPAWFIKLFTLPGDVVLDPFLGSGTTAVAAKELGRHYVGIDTNEAYCAEAVRRLAQLEMFDDGAAQTESG